MVVIDTLVPKKLNDVVQGAFVPVVAEAKVLVSTDLDKDVEGEVVVVVSCQVQDQV